MLGEVLHRQNFGDPVADPFGVIEMVRLGDACRPQVVGDPVQQRQQASALGRHRQRAVVLDDFDGGRQQLVGAAPFFENAETLAAMRGDHQDAELLHFPFANARQRADGMGFGRLADFVAGRDQANAKGLLFLHASRRHVEIALLENFQREHAAGEEQGIERKQWNFHSHRCRFGLLLGAGKTEPAHHAPQRCISVCGTAS